MYMGYNGFNAAQLGRPQGSTLTFQHKVGVSWVHGLRHGVTMHPRGRHLREGMIPWSHGKRHTQACEQQPNHTTNLPHNNGEGDVDGRRLCRHSATTIGTSNFRTSAPTITTTTLQHNAGKIKRQLGQEPRKFPLRDANQRRSIASVDWGPGELNMTVEPTANVSNRQCESWLGPFGTRWCRRVTDGEISR